MSIRVVGRGVPASCFGAARDMPRSDAAASLLLPVAAAAARDAGAARDAKQLT